MLEDHPEIVRRVLRDVEIVIYTEPPDRKVVEFVGRCDQFDPVAPAETMPTYDAEYDPLENTVIWTRRQD